MKLLMCRMLAFQHQTPLLQQTISYSTSVPGETTLHAGLITRPMETRLLNKGGSKPQIFFLNYFCL